MEQTWLVAAEWVGLALIASILAIRTRISVALMEIFVGVLAGNFLGLTMVSWANFLAGFGAILLTFLAGAEIEPEVMRRYFKEAVTIGFISFLAPFLGAMAYAYYVAGWTLQGAQIAGVALSTTSVAVVYAVMLETGLKMTLRSARSSWPPASSRIWARSRRSASSSPTTMPGWRSF